MILEDDLSLNLCIMLTTYYMVIVLENQSLVRRGLLADLSWKSIDVRHSSYLKVKVCGVGLNMHKV